MRIKVNESLLQCYTKLYSTNQKSIPLSKDGLNDLQSKKIYLILEVHLSSISLFISAVFDNIFILRVAMIAC